MSTEDLDASGRVLRVSLVTPMVYAVAAGLGLPLPFVAALLFATLALQLAAPPPFGSVALLALVVVLLPLAFGGLASVLNAYPYMLVGIVGLVLFHSFRLQAAPRTALFGVLLQTFAIMLPIITGAAPQAAEVVSYSLGLNGILAIAGLYFAFAVFPERAPAGPASAPPASGDAGDRTRNAAVAALVMVPPFALLLAFDLASAMRVVFTIAIVLGSLNQRDAHATGAERVLATLMAGAVALAATAIFAIWPAPAAAMVGMAFLGLLVVPHAFKGRHRGAVALAVPMVWALLSTASDNVSSKTLTWCLYSILGVFYAIWARAVLLRLLGWVSWAPGRAA